MLKFVKYKISEVAMEKTLIKEVTDLTKLTKSFIMQFFFNTSNETAMRLDRTHRAHA